jgi:hypothetical protein
MQYLGVYLFMLFKNAFKAHRDYLIFKYLGITSWKKKCFNRFICKNIQQGFGTYGIWSINEQAMVDYIGPSQGQPSNYQQCCVKFGIVHCGDPTPC